MPQTVRPVGLPPPEIQGGYLQAQRREQAMRKDAESYQQQQQQQEHERLRYPQQERAGYQEQMSFPLLQLSMLRNPEEHGHPTSWGIQGVPVGPSPTLSTLRARGVNLVSPCVGLMGGSYMSPYAYPQGRMTPLSPQFIGQRPQVGDFAALYHSLVQDSNANANGNSGPADAPPPVLSSAVRPPGPTTPSPQNQRRRGPQGSGS